MKHFLFFLLCVGFAVTATFWVSAQAQDDPEPPNPVYDPLLISPHIDPASFSCNCNKACTEITTCEEAYFQLVDCGCDERDTDSDGIPCEGLCEGVNPAPVAVGDEYTTPYGTPLIVSAENGVLKNDQDYNGDTLSAIKVTNTNVGYLVLNADGSFEYTPESNFSGTDSFVYKVTDGTSESSEVTVRITVAPVNNEIELHYPQGFIGDTQGVTYTFTHIGISNYVIFVAPQSNLGAPRFYDVISSYDYCQGTECSVKLSDITDAAWLENNAYEAWICGTRGSICEAAEDWQGPFRFTLMALWPGRVDFLSSEELTGITWTGTPADDPPSFVWQLDVDANRASWFQVWYGYVVPQAGAPTIYWPITFDWFPRTELCQGDLCALKTTTNKLCFNGHYAVYVKSWGPGGFSSGGIDGWADFQLETCVP